MVRKSVFIIVAAVILAVIPQIIYAGWARTFGGELDDHGCSVEQTSDGGYIIAGQTYSFGEGNVDAWLLKTDSKGDTLWSRTYGSAGVDVAEFVHQTTDGGYIITGAKVSVEEDNDIWLLKTDSLGDILWEKCYGGADHDHGWCVQETSDSGYIIAGHRDLPKAGCGGYDMWLLKTDPMGDTVWTRTFFRSEPPIGVATAYYVQETSDGGYIAVGDLAGGSDSDLFLVKINSEGDSLWAVTYDFLGFEDRGYCVKETSDGNYIISGFAEKDRGTGDLEIWLLKTDSLGDTLWTRTFGGEKFDSGLFVSITYDDGYIIAGLKNCSPPAWSDLWLIKTDSDGNEVWNRTYGKDGVEDDWAYCVRETSDLGFIITGGTNSWGAGGYDLWLIKTDSLGLLAVDERPPVTPVTYQPDWQVTPIGLQIVLRYGDRPEGFHASIFDATGCKVDEIHSSNASGTITWGEWHRPGVYFIRIEGERSSPQKVILLK